MRGRIRSRAPDAEIYSVRALGPLKGWALFLAGIESVVSMCLSSKSEWRSAPLHKVVDAACFGKGLLGAPPSINVAGATCQFPSSPR